MASGFGNRFCEKHFVHQSVCCKHQQAPLNSNEEPCKWKYLRDTRASFGIALLSLQLLPCCELLPSGRTSLVQTFAHGMHLFMPKSESESEQGLHFPFFFLTSVSVCYCIFSLALVQFASTQVSRESKVYFCPAGNGKPIMFFVLT